MRIHIATDHAGLELSHFLIAELGKQGHEVFDHGPDHFDPLDDYPAFCISAALAVVAIGAWIYISFFLIISVNNGWWQPERFISGGV